ncbi:MAG: TetR family transcriptional regulator [Clostridia bacterium]|nr:TetR family transcriptional regulator [Clostridia bacterium]MBO7289525.1 TetR family transcriptional regulator [Clostridia bacterium]
MNNPELIKEKILLAAEDIFAEKGLAGTRVDEIAKLSGVNKRLIYVLFDSKEIIYKTVLNRVYSRLVDMETSQNIHLPADEVLRQKIFSTFEFLIKNPNFVSLVMHENLNQAKYIDSAGIIPIKSKSVVALQKLIKKGIDDGIFRKDIDINEMVFAINMFVFSYFSNKYTMPKLVDVDLSNEDSAKYRCNMVADMIIGYLKNK